MIRRVEVKEKKQGFEKIKCIIMAMIMFIGIMTGISVQAKNATLVSSKVSYDGRGAYFATVTASNSHYGKVDENESYFYAQLYNSKLVQSVYSPITFFQGQKQKTAYSATAAWKYEGLRAKLRNTYLSK